MKITKSILLGCLAAFSVATSTVAATPPPNIVFILADDLGYTDLTCYGAPKIRTPNIDQLAKQGMKFTDFYATACVCTPTRASLMTGCYPKRVGLHERVLQSHKGKGLNPAETTIAEVLRARGYATAIIGKWHLGDEPEVMPTAQGFDSYFGMIGENHGTSDLYRNATLIATNKEVDKSQLTQRYTVEALKFIKDSAATKRPFFLYFAHSAVHTPLYASERFRSNSAAGLYGDMTEELDWSVGEVLKTLNELGLEKNTLVVFTSDNGQAGVAAPPLHGGKGSTWEGGNRVPAIARMPGRIAAGSVTHEMTIMFDWSLTLAELGGGSFPDKTDGHSLWPVLEGKKLSAPLRDSFVYYGRDGLPAAIREGKWKLHVLAPSEKWAGKLPPEALLDKKPQTPPPWLYDLAADISETNNIAAQHPDIVEKLRHDLEQTDTMLAREARPVFEKVTATK